MIKDVKKIEFPKYFTQHTDFPKMLLDTDLIN